MEIKEKDNSLILMMKKIKMKIIAKKKNLITQNLITKKAI